MEVIAYGRIFPVDEYGHQVQRTKQEYPYSYDGFVTWRGGENKEVTGTVYNDRLWQWDWDKYNKLCEKHWGNKGQMWYDRSAESTEAFLRDYMEEPNLKLILIMEYCNVSNGFPVWRFDYSLSTANNSK